MLADDRVLGHHQYPVRCLQRLVELGDEYQRGPARRNRDSAAKQVCEVCPVLAQCRAHALQVREPYGVWGGMTEDEREAVYATGSPNTAA